MTVINYNGDIFEKIPNEKPGYYNWIGKKSHYLTVVDAYFRITDGKPKQRYFLCECECGKTKLVHGDGIRKQRIKSCGCWKSIVDSKKAKSMGESNCKHGMFGTRIYRIWSGMIERCTNENSKDYKNYGARGIRVCERWLDFKNFYEDNKEKYADNLTIDRIDVNGDYRKSNCRWVTMDEQAGNKRNTIYIEHQGKKLRLEEWSKITGISRGALYQRYVKGLTPKQILKSGKLTKISLRMNDEEHSIKEWSKRTGLSEKVIRTRYDYGWDHERILTTPVRQNKRRKK